jgi:hypothetical protein
MLNGTLAFQASLYAAHEQEGATYSEDCLPFLTSYNIMLNLLRNSTTDWPSNGRRRRSESDDRGQKVQAIHLDH